MTILTYLNSLTLLRNHLVFFFNDKLNKICAVKCESSNKPVRNCSSKITSDQAITESLVQQKLVNHFSKGSSSSKGKSAKKSV